MFFVIDYVRPICLLVGEQMQSIPMFTVTGWGETEYGQFSRILLNATLYNMDISYCNIKFNKQADRSQICAGSHTSNTCKGDSGGPLSSKFHYGNRLLSFQYGLVSYGSERCAANVAGVYTNVSYHREWIFNKMVQFKPTGHTTFWLSKLVGQTCNITDIIRNIELMYNRIVYEN